MRKLITLLLVFCFSFTIESKSQINESTDVKITKHRKIENIRMAYQLVKYGYQNESALSLVNAIDILLKQKITNLKLYSSDSNQIEGQIKNYEYLNSILEFARSQANDDKNMLAIIDNCKKELFILKASRGAVGGARVGNHTIIAKGSNFFWVVFKQNELAEVSVIGIGDNVLELYIYDDKNNLVHKDTKRKTECYLNWYPEEKKAYRIKIKNNANNRINYSVTTD